MKYIVEITEVVQKRIKIEAESEWDAIDKVANKYYEGEIMLNDISPCVDFDLVVPDEILIGPCGNPKGL